MTSTPRPLTELQHALLRILWDAGEATVTEVQDALERDGRAMASTSVATLLKRLTARGAITHRREGRQFVYRAVVTEDDASRSAVRELASRVTASDLPELVNQLLASRAVRPGDLARVKEMIEAKERELASDS